MNRPVARETAPQGPEPATARTDYTGAVYGSLLAASVVATAGAAGEFPRLQLVVLLLVTGLVFWAAHVYARLAGERFVGQATPWSEVRMVARHEWSIVEAATLPAAAIALGAVFGLDLDTSGWIALGVAVAQMVGWSCLGARKAGASRRQVVLEGLVNLVLGLVIVAAKGALSH
ncbi:hypothetical protein KNE206_60330 [Kitasatospora sp. NE20-6]|uniref:hypothetical protein n=1 Tax=Kitasatospora sp. NE20-6 TaxID=2859066 RepID=UPI0034DBF012